MVFINDQKFACESCIKGHRSSSCAHNDRPLFEVKKKGRLITQCDKCRNLRQTRYLHSRCICVTRKAQKATRPLSAKSKRCIPILPALPNGVRDALVISNGSNTPPPDPIARVDTLPDHCNCEDICNCKCNAAENVPVACTSRWSGESCLITLAIVAASLCCPPPSGSDPIPTSSENSTHVPQKRPRDCCQSSPTTQYKYLRRERSPQRTSPAHRSPDLPPVLIVSSAELPSADRAAEPTSNPEIPPFRSIVSLAGSGCTCGFDCTCTEHRGLESPLQERDNIAPLAVPSTETIGSARKCPDSAISRPPALSWCRSTSSPPRRPKSVGILDRVKATVDPIWVSSHS